MAREITSLTGLPPTVSLVKYTAVRHSVVSEVARAFRAYVNIGRNFFSPPPNGPPNKLAAANRETVQCPKAIEMKSLLFRCGQFLYLKPLFAFLSLIIFP